MHSNHLFLYNDMHMLPYLQLVHFQFPHLQCHHIFQYSCLYIGNLQCSRVFNKSTMIVRFKLESFLYVFRTYKYFTYLDKTWAHGCKFDQLDHMAYDHKQHHSLEGNNGHVQRLSIYQRSNIDMKDVPDIFFDIHEQRKLIPIYLIHNQCIVHYGSMSL